MSTALERRARDMVKAAIRALGDLRMPEDIAALRGKSLEEIRG